MKKIQKISVLICAVLCAVLLVPSNVEASTMYLDETYNLNYDFPDIEGSLDSTIMVPLNHNKSFKVDMTFSTSNYYLVFVTGYVRESAVFKSYNNYDSNKDNVVAQQIQNMPSHQHNLYYYHNYYNF